MLHLTLTFLGCVLLSLPFLCSSATSAPFQDLLVIDCNSALHILPSHPLFRTSLDASIASSVYTSVVNTIRTRASCHCPSLSSSELAQSFNADFGSFLAAVETGTDNSTSRTRCGLTFSMDQAGLAFNQSLPNTCTHALWAAGSPCALQMAVPNFPLTLQVALQQCPGRSSSSSLPFVSVSCSGALCSDLLVPCSADSDCVKSKCISFQPNATQSGLNSGLASFLDSTGIFPISEQSTACPTQYNASTSGTANLNGLLQQVRSLMLPYASAASGQLSLGVCGIDAFTANGISLSDFKLLSFSSPSALWGSLNTLAQRTTSAAGPLGWFASALRSNSIVSYVSTPVLSFLQLAGDVLKPIATQISSTFYTTYSRAAWTTLTSWTGTLDDGTSATSSARITGSAFPSLVPPTPTPLTTSTSYVPLIQSTCDLLVTILPKQPFSLTVQLPNFQATLQAAMSQAEGIANCRSPGYATLNFHALFNPLAAEFWLNLFTVQAGSNSSANSIPSNLLVPAQKLFSLFNSTILPALNMPATCTLQTFASTGVCSGEYTGLNTLFNGLDLTLRWTLSRCSAYPDALPALNLQCVGANCAAFFNPTQIAACTQDSNCQTGSTCNAVSSTLLTAPLASSWFTNNEQQCDNSNMDVLEVVNYFRTFIGQPSQSFVTTQNSTLGYCSMIWQNTVSSQLSLWTGQATQKFYTNNTISVVGLNAYVPATTPVVVASSTGAVNPSSLPANSAQVTFSVVLPTNPPSAFGSLLLEDVASDMAGTYPASSNVTAVQVLPYLSLIGISSSSRRLLATGAFSFYVLGDITNLASSSSSLSALTLADQFASDVTAGKFLTPNSQAQVPISQAVTVAKINSQSNGAVSASLTVILPALIAAVTYSLL